MTVKKYDVQKNYEQVRVTKDESIHILKAVVRDIAEAYHEDLAWRTEGDALVFEWPMDTITVGGEDFFEED